MLGLSLAYFFSNQQFTTWGMRADCGNYVVATYKTTKLHNKQKEKEKLN